MVVPVVAGLPPGRYHGGVSTAPHQQLLRFYAAALKAVEGRACVRKRLAGESFHAPLYLVAIGKAATAMAHGACDALGGQVARALVITKHGHADPLWQEPRLTQLEAGHPVPDDASFAAGRALLGFIAAAPADASFLFLISGGASALVEVPRPGMTPALFAELNQWLLGSGWDIARMNRVRRALSAIKGGRLAVHLCGRRVLNLLMSDVPGDDPAVIGSGLLVPDAAPPALPTAELPDWVQPLLPSLPEPPVPDCFRHIHSEILLTNRTALEAAAAAAVHSGLVVYRPVTTLVGDAASCGRTLATTVCAGPPGLYLWGGETTVRLPDQPGRGGRCQHLALAAAQVLAGREDVWLLAAGTDGSDGPTEDAGALVDGATLARGGQEGLDAADSLRRADAGSFLEASGDLIQTGPTGSNVMDLVLALKLGDNGSRGLQCNP